jgi:hypothetical protein
VFGFGSTEDGAPSSPVASSRLLFFARKGDDPGSVFTFFADADACEAAAAALSASIVFIMS